MGNNKEFDVSGIFSSVLLIVGGGELITIQCSSLSQLVGNNMEFDVGHMF